MKVIEKASNSFTVTDIDEKTLVEKINAGLVHISQVIEPSIRVQEAAVNKQPSNIRFILKPDKSLLLKTIKAYPYAITMLNNLDERTLLSAVRLNPMVIEFIKERKTNFKLRRTALKTNPVCAQFLTDFTEEEIQIIFDNNPEALRFVFKEPSQWIFRAVMKKPSTIVIFEKAGIIGKPSEEDGLSTEYWKVALNKDPYLAYYLTEDEQRFMIMHIENGLKETNYMAAFTQLYPKIREIVVDDLFGNEETK